ncbi:MAG: PEP-CTERM sorting domain-containing protein [Verrucomicrobia bacterium]|nr:PEP-CTERM sorting domain-containing protein [Verrucomicrobiota bacterium]
MRLRTLLKRRQLVREEYVQRGWGWICSATMAILFLLALPAPLTRHWIQQSASESPEISRRAIERLRAWGDEGIILRECHGRANRMWFEIFMGSFQEPNPDRARQAYFGVTGRPFNAVPPPLTKYQAAGRAVLDEFEWDPALGGTSVAGQVKGLALAQSRFDGLCRANEGWAYLEWTLEFRNDHERTPREARSQVLLPSDGVVSRLTLWVNGEEREAAFAETAHVREAYETVTVVQKRDPVLVTVAGPDRVLVQCFPVPAQGGAIKVRLGITAPLMVEDKNSVALRLPTFLERNFAVSPNLKHSFWMESRVIPVTRLSGVTLDSSKPDKFAIRGQFSDAELASPAATLRFGALPKATSASDKTDTNHFVIQKLEAKPAKAPERLASVLDGSENMTRLFPEIARAFQHLPAESEVAVFIAKDGASQIACVRGSNHRLAAEAVRALQGVGGQDGLPALSKAWEWAATKSDSVVLWIHGPQPVLLSSAEWLKQCLEWRREGARPRLMEMTTQPGPNRIAEQLAHVNAFASVPRLGEARENIERLFAIWTGRQPDWKYVRTSRANDAPTDSETASGGSMHLVRLWAFEHIKSLLGLRRTAEAATVAIRYRLVTAATGAVVLETKRQFAEAGLTPADPATVPVVPEPGTWALLVLGFAMVTIWRSRTRIRNTIQRAARAE